MSKDERSIDTSRAPAAGARLQSGNPSLLLHEVAGVGAARVLLVGLGKEADFTDRAYAEAVRTALRVELGPLEPVQQAVRHRHPDAPRHHHQAPDPAEALRQLLVAQLPRWRDARLQQQRLPHIGADAGADAGAHAHVVGADQCSSTPAAH